MNVAMRVYPMTQEEFFPWAELQDEPYEFDGTGPVAMNGVTEDHDIVCQNLWGFLRNATSGGEFRVSGPSIGVETVAGAVRYPDALIAPRRSPTSLRKLPGVLVVFEVVSPTSGIRDRIEKVREYGQVETILRYVVIELATMGLTNFWRAEGGQPWTATTLTESDVLHVPEVGIELPVAELYAGIDFAEITPASD